MTHYTFYPSFLLPFRDLRTLKNGLAIFNDFSCTVWSKSPQFYKWLLLENPGAKILKIYPKMISTKEGLWIIVFHHRSCRCAVYSYAQNLPPIFSTSSFTDWLPRPLRLTESVTGKDPAVPMRICGHFSVGPLGAPPRDQGGSPRGPRGSPGPWPP